MLYLDTPFTVTVQQYNLKEKDTKLTHETLSNFKHGCRSIEET